MRNVMREFNNFVTYLVIVFSFYQGFKVDELPDSFATFIVGLICLLPACILIGRAIEEQQMLARASEVLEESEQILDILKRKQNEQENK